MNNNFYSLPEHLAEAAQTCNTVDELALVSNLHQMLTAKGGKYGTEVMMNLVNKRVKQAEERIGWQ